MHWVLQVPSPAGHAKAWQLSTPSEQWPAPSHAARPRSAALLQKVPPHVFVAFGKAQARRPLHDPAHTFSSLATPPSGTVDGHATVSRRVGLDQQASIGARERRGNALFSRVLALGHCFTRPGFSREVARFARSRTRSRSRRRPRIGVPSTRRTPHTPPLSPSDRQSRPRSRSRPPPQARPRCTRQPCAPPRRCRRTKRAQMWPGEASLQKCTPFTVEVQPYGGVGGTPRAKWCLRGETTCLFDVCR